jgi:speckle-type POZ protein
MADAKMSSITLHDIAAATFKVMLRFIYTDALPEDGEIGDSPTKVFQDLLAVADRSALDRLKLLCASKLWRNASVDTFATTLVCAETYNCGIELKRKCIAFFCGGEKLQEGGANRWMCSAHAEVPIYHC